MTRSRSRSRPPSPPPRTARVHTVALAVASALAGSAWANPSGPSVAAGAATFSASGNTLNITNAPGTIINWQQFSIRPDEITRFIQSGAASAVLNRVTGAEHSQLLGQLLSNGRVFLINPNGVTIGAGARIDTAGFIASSLNIADADFLSGRLRFQAVNGEPGKVVNQGAISAASGGSVYLIAPNVENHGVITAPNGDVLLAAGKSVEVVASASPHIRVEVAAPAGGEALNVGQVVGGRIGIYGGLVRNAGTLNATTAMVGENGNIILKAGGDVRLEGGTVKAAAVDGGKIRIEGDRVVQGAAVDASGANGGTVSIAANTVQQSARIDASGSSGRGGAIDVQSEGSLVQTAGTVLDASGAAGGGAVTVQGTGERRVFSSATMKATSSAGAGGEIKVLGADVMLAGAKLDASGESGGGRVLVGGDFRGANPDVPNAQYVSINTATAIAADAGATGTGGDVVVWADRTASFAGTITARGGAQSGDGGTVEVSGKESVQVLGHVDASAASGTPGRLIIDPKNIVIAATAPSGSPVIELNDPNPGAFENFGATYELIGGARVVATDPQDSAGRGAAYLFDVAPGSPTQGALLATLTGATTSDAVGDGGISVFSGADSFVVRSTAFNGGAGAITFGSAAGFAGGGGVVGAGNSLVGAAAGHGVGSAVVDELVSGFRFALVNPTWNGGRGAVTFGDALAGMPVGQLSAANSVVGLNANDQIGSGGLSSVGPTLNEGVAIISPGWNGNRGAVTYVSMAAPTATPVDGVIAPIAGTFGDPTTVASLVGANAGDAVGSGGVTRLTNGHYVVRSPDWGGGAGALTWANGSTGAIGTVGAGNSLTGTAPGDFLGQSITPLSNGNYVVVSPSALNGSGAATLVAGEVGGEGRPIVNGVVDNYGAIGVGNSLLGDGPGAFGGATVVELTNGVTGVGYALMTPSWGGNAGAVTVLPNGGAGAGPTGVIGSSISLIGTTPGASFDADRVGSQGSLFNLGGGQYVLATPEWTNIATSAPRAGALTPISVAAPPVGPISAANSLVGTLPNDRVGSGTFDADLIPLSGGWFAFHSPSWNNGAGAVTFFTAGNAATRLLGPVSATANSLVGSTSGDRIGTFQCDGTCDAITDMLNGTFLVASPDWSNGALAGVGAVTLVDPAAGTATGPRSNGIGVVGTINSIVGATAGDAVGGSNITFGGGAFRLDNDRYAIVSPDWDNGTFANAGAVTFGTVSGWIPGTVTAANSLHGTGAGDRVGSDGLFPHFSSGPATFGVVSSFWGGDRGAITFFDAASAPVGAAVGDTNSVVGVTAGDVIGSRGFVDVGAGKALVLSPNWGGGRGLAALVDVNASRSGGVAVTAGNSFTGVNPSDFVGDGGVYFLPNGNFVLRSFANDAGAYTFMTPANARAGETLSTTNSLVGGGTFYESLGFDFRVLPTGDYIVVNPGYGFGSEGVIVFGSATTGVVGTPSALNGWRGTAVGEGLGSQVELLANEQFVFNAPGATKGSFDGAGRLYIANPSGLGGGGINFTGTLTFADFPTDTVTIAAPQIASILNTGTQVLLQASNDISVNAPIDALGTTLSNGSLTMQAGRSILVNADIVNRNVNDGDGRSVVLQANDPNALAAQRDPGLGELRMAPGVRIVGGGDVVLEVLDGAGPGTAGAMTLGNISGANVEIFNSALINPAFDPNRSIDLAPGSVITVSQRFALVADGDARFGAVGGVGARVEGITGSADVVAFGALTGGSGTLIDASANVFPVNLSAQSIGSAAHPFGLVHGFQGVVATSVTGGIHLVQTAGVLDTGFYLLDAPVGQQVSLGSLGGPLDVSQINMPNANPLRLHTAGDDISFFNPIAVIDSALLQLDAGTGQIEVPLGGGVTFNGPVQASSFMALRDGTTVFNGGATLAGIGVTGNGTVLDIGAGGVSTTSLTWGQAFTAQNNTITGNPGSTLTVTGSSGASISGDGVRTLNNAGLVLGPSAASLYVADLAGGGAINLLGTASLTNNGILTISNDNPIAAPATSLNTFTNNGFITKIGGTGATVIGGPVGQVNFNNTGTLRVNSGRIALANNSTLGGSVILEPGAGLDLTGGAGHTSTGGISGPGTLTIANATLTANAPITTGLTSVGTGGVLTSNNAMAGQLDVAGTANLNGAAVLTGVNVTGGTLNVTTPGTLTTNTFTQGGGAVQGTGDLTVLSSFTRSGGTFAGTFANLEINQAVGNLNATGLDAVTSIKLAAPGGTLTVPTAIAVSGLAKLAGNGVSLNADVSGGTIELVSPNVQLGSVTLTGPVNAAAASLFVPDGAAVTLAGGGASTVRDLTVGGNGGSLALTGATTVTNNFLWQGASGASTISGGTLNVNGNAAIGGDGTHTFDGTQVFNNGSMIFGPTFGGGGPLQIQNGAALTNNGTLDLQNNQPILSNAGAGTLRNLGTLVKSGAGGDTVLGGSTAIPPGTFTFDNQGSVVINSGRLVLNEAGTQAGSFAMGPLGGLAFSSGTHTLTGNISGGTLGVSGTANVTLAGSLATNLMDISGGTLDIDGAATTSAYNQTGGLVGGTGDLAVGSSFSQTGGSFGNTFNTLSITQATGDIEGSGFGATGQLALAAPGGFVNISNPLALVGNASFFGGSGINVTAPVTAASVGMVTPGTARISNATVQATGGIISVAAGQVEVIGGSAPAGLLAAAGLNVATTGDIVLQGGSGAGAHAELNAGSGPLALTVQRNLKLAGGAGPDAYALVIGDPDVGSMAAPIKVGGLITMDAGGGADAFARIESVSANSIYVAFPNLSAGGYTVNGVEAVAAGNSGFFAGGSPAVLDRNLFITYGILPPPPGSTLADPNAFLAALNRSTELLGDATEDQQRRELLALFEDIEDAPVCK